MAESGSNPDPLKLWAVIFFHQHLPLAPSKTPCTFRSILPESSYLKHYTAFLFSASPFQWRDLGVPGRVEEEMEKGMQATRGCGAPSSLRVCHPSVRLGKGPCILSLCQIHLFILEYQEIFSGIFSWIFNIDDNVTCE